MKRFSILLIGFLLLITSATRGQNAAAVAAAQAEREAAEERYKRLSSAVDDLLAAQTEQQKRIAALAKEIESLREQMSKPTGNYASSDELRALTQTVEKINQKREDDKELILREIAKLGKIGPASSGPRNKTPSPDTPPGATPDKPKGYKYEIKSGDTLSVIALAYQKQGIKITVDQILKANPKLDAAKLKVGQEIWIPAPDKQ